MAGGCEGAAATNFNALLTYGYYLNTGFSASGFNPDLSGGDIGA